MGCKYFFSPLNALRLHTGNLVNRSRLKKKCPGSPSEELRDCIQATLRDWLSLSAIRDAVEMGEPQQSSAVSFFFFLPTPHLKLLGFFLPPPACQTLAVSQLDSVIIVPPGPVEGDSQTLAHLQPAWEQLEALVRKQKIAAIGTSDLDKELLEQLYNWAQVKPSSNQVNLASCCVMPPDLTAFAKEFDIQLLTHNDAKELMSAAAFQEAMQEGLPGLSTTDWRLEWVLRYSVIVKSRGIIKSKGYLVSARRASP
uniref:GCS light chain n=1 Tax=Fundulus heteroclitus TaxID=8078 RepID=A0A3Q2NVX0_FUNHE